MFCKIKLPQPVAQPVVVIKCCISENYVLHNSNQSIIFATCYSCKETNIYSYLHDFTRWFNIRTNSNFTLCRHLALILMKGDINRINEPIVNILN